MIIGGVPMAMVVTVAIFLPGFLLVLGACRMSFSKHPRFRGAARAVVGLLAAMLISPMLVGTVSGWLDALLALVLFVLLMKWKVKPILLVLLGFLCGVIFY